MLILGAAWYLDREAARHDPGVPQYALYSYLLLLLRPQAMRWTARAVESD